MKDWTYWKNTFPTEGDTRQVHWGFGAGSQGAPDGGEMYGVNHIGDKTPWYSPHIVAGNLPLTPAISEYSLK